ncbi:MAG: alcohol dehydrogenase catalytic domain-containing protein, partial [Lachnospiraceae bacterium]
MKALVRNENGEIRIADIPEPYILKEDEVKIRVLYSAFCRDDMRYEDKTDVFSHIGVVGHEVVGVIEELGSYAQYAGFSLEDTVLVLPWESCGKCENCLSQRTQCCTEAHVVMGTMTKHIIRASRQLIKLDSDITFKQAVLMEPVGGVIEGLSKLPIDYDKEVLIIGAGFTGLV